MSFIFMIETVPIITSEEFLSKLKYKWKLLEAFISPAWPLADSIRIYEIEFRSALSVVPHLRFSFVLFSTEVKL